MTIEIFIDGRKAPVDQVQRLFMEAAIGARSNGLEGRAERYLQYLLEVGR